MTFRELEPYYSTEARSPCGDSLDTGGMRQKMESSSDGERRMVGVGRIPCPLVDSARVEQENEDSAMVQLQREDSTVVEPQREDSTVVEHKVERNGSEGGRTQVQRESRYREVYVRRNKQSEGAVTIVPPVPSPLSLPTSTPETLTPFTSDSVYTGAMIPLSTTRTSLSVRRTPRENAGIPPDRYGFPHEIAQFVSYSHISPVHRAFIASLDTVSIPKCWQVAKGDPKWKEPC